MREAGINLKYDSFDKCRHFLSSDLRSISAAIEALHGTTCIICLASDLAARVCELADVLGMRIPEDLSVATLGHRWMYSSSGEIRILLGLSYEWERICSFCIDLLESHANGSKRFFSQIKVEPFLVVDANTVGPPGHK